MTGFAATCSVTMEWTVGDAAAGAEGEIMLHVLKKHLYFALGTWHQIKVIAPS